MELRTKDKKIKILEHALAATAGAYYSINLTKNVVPGTMYQVIDDKEYSLNEKMGMPENARFTDVVLYWGEKLEPEVQPGYYDFLSIPNLLKRYHDGEYHVFFQYWTKSALHKPMLAEQHIIMYEEEESGDILGITYVLDLTQKHKEEEYKKELEEQKAQLEHALEDITLNNEIIQKGNQILSGLSIDYTIAFVLDLDTDDYEIAFSQKTNHAQVDKDSAKFKDYVAKYADHFAIGNSVKTMKQELSSVTIKERFETKDEYHFSFETVPNAAGLSCFQAHIVKQYAGDHHYAFLGFRSVDEVVRQERYYKEALKKANQALKKQLDLITNALPGGVKISNDDATYSFKYVSQQFAGMLGYQTPEELIEASGGNIVGLAHPDDVERGIAEALRQYETSDHYEITYRVKCSDGSWKYIEDRGHKFHTPDGNVEHWNLILDKHELMEKTIALESEKKASQSKSDFLSRMSHDMRTPLNGIIGLLDINKKHADDRKLVDENRMKARVAADHLMSLINDTLELSKLENNEAPLYEETFYMPELVREVEIIAQMRAEEEKITFSYRENADRMEHPYLTGSPLYVKQILLNLITNGIKYNRENGSVYCVMKEKECSATEVEIEFTIHDTGIGMSQEFLKEVFKPFVQADHGPRSTYMGTGLGMAIVKNLLDRMNGTIQIDSVEGKGSTVDVVIPFKIAKMDESAECVRKTEKKKRLDDHLHVLLAEDNELNREIATFILKDAGMEVTETTDGEQALAVYQKMPDGYFDVILMDIMMPSMNGYEATHAIRSSGRQDSRTIPIIAMTANAFDDDREKSKKATMNAHLSKPLEAQKLVDTIESCIAKNHIKEH